MKNGAWLGPWHVRLAWLGLLVVAVALRVYHLTGFALDYHEAHWLVYSLDKRLLFEAVRSSRPRPDLLFALIASVPVRFFGPNELAVRIGPVVAGSLCLFPLAVWIFQVTGKRMAAWFGAAFLAVLPLSVYYSSEGVPDTIAFLFGLCALVFLMRAKQTRAPTSFVWMSICLALALLTKATALYCWGFMAIAGVVLFENRRDRRMFYLALGLSIVPLVLVTCAILLRSQTMTFFREPGITESFGLSLSRQWLQLRCLSGFLQVLSIVAAIGAVVVVRRAAKGSPADRQLLIWLLPLAGLAVTPLFRAGRVDLLWLIPTVCLFGAVALSSLRQSVAGALAAAVTVILLVGTLVGVSLPDPGPALPASDYTTAVLKRPAGWPSREGASWLMAHTTPEDAILCTAFTFTDALLLDVSRFRHVILNGGSHWALLRDPANRVKYAVFSQDYRGYAPSLAAYCDTHFTLPAGAQFPNYAIYDCQQGGKFVAYPDAYSSDHEDAQRGQEFLEEHQLERALAAFQRVVEVNPNQPVANVNLALLYYQLGRESEGIAQCEHNIRAGIAPAVSYGVLGQFREKRGDLDGARAAYEWSLAIDPTNQVTKQLLANLKGRVPSSSAPPQ
jgi:hypothetical protein